MDILQKQEGIAGMNGIAGQVASGMVPGGIPGTGQGQWAPQGKPLPGMPGGMQPGGFPQGGAITAGGMPAVPEMPGNGMPHGMPGPNGMRQGMGQNGMQEMPQEGMQMPDGAMHPLGNTGRQMMRLDWIPDMQKGVKKLDIQKALAFVEEARRASDDWRRESWRDLEMYDGAQWDEESYERARECGIEPITINRIFPAVNLIIGSNELNKANIVAKGRTSKDGTTADLMSEAISYCLDQNNGKFLITQAFRDSVVPGIGWLYCGFNMDPRKEKVLIEYRDWKEVFWDPYSSPWLDSGRTRYVFFQRWMDLFDLIEFYPERRKELEEVAAGLGDGQMLTPYGADDAANWLEMDTRIRGTTKWADPERKRVRPVQMWYPVLQKCVFALFDDGTCIEISENRDPMQTYQIVRNARQIITSTVRKLRVKTFLGNYELEDRPSPFSHDEYPFVPFVGYVDRTGAPFGVPRMIRGQNIEVNKRRSMNLALLTKRRVLMEEGATDDPEAAYEEINKLDGFAMLRPGGIAKTTILEGTQLSQYQISIMEQSEKEIQQISGVNAEATGYQSNADSGKAIELRRQQSSTVMASVFENYRRSLARLGKILVANIQSAWTAPKVLRVTDKMTQAERFVQLNQKILQDGTVVDVKNDITQGVYDIVVSDAPASDSVREQNMQMLIEWTKQSPPEAIPFLMGMAMEMSNLPNKDQLMMKLRPLMGITPEEMDMGKEELEQKMKQETEQKQQEMAMKKQLEMQVAEAQLQKMQLDNKMLEAKIRSELATASRKDRDQDRKDFEAGVNAGEKILNAKQQQKNLKMAEEAAGILQNIRNATSGGGSQPETVGEKQMNAPSMTPPENPGSGNMELGQQPDRPWLGR